MAHSIELIADDDTDAAVRRDWAALAEAGLPSQAHHRSPTNRPHVTLTVGQRIAATVDQGLVEYAGRLPLACLIGAPMVFGGAKLTLVRLVVPTTDLLVLQAGVDATAAPHVTGDAFPHTRPGQWTPHVTLCRRLPVSDLPAALEVIGDDDLSATFTGLRRWDGDAREDHPIQPAEGRG